MLRTPFKQSVSLIAILGAIALAGCETTGTNSAAAERVTTEDLPPAPLAEDALSQATYWGARYEAEPDNPEMAVRFSTALRNLGSYEEANSLMTRTVTANSNNADVLIEYARVMVAMQRGEQALQPIARAIAQRPGDWKLHSLEGVAHDQAGDFDTATQSYERALGISPNNPDVLNNYGLSRALAGDLEGAEAMLRAAVAEPGATARMRQNLALVLGLQGNFEEAEQLGRADLPPEAVANNMDYYRAMLTQPAAWNELEAPTDDEAAQ